jgi:hypothetical protein
MFFKAVAVLGAVGSAVAQRPSNTSICDYYTTALLKNNTAANQMTLLTLVVNTAVIGNCRFIANLAVLLLHLLPCTDTYQTLHQMLASRSLASLHQEFTMAHMSICSHTLMEASPLPMVEVPPVLLSISSMTAVLLRC